MLLELLKGRHGVLKSSVVAEFSVALDVLEDWEQDGEDAASPESLEPDHIKWVENLVSQEFFFSDELSSGEALSSQEE